jgi:hypothetical protein
MNCTPALARSTNSFSNAGSIVGRGRPFSTAKKEGVAAQHFQPLQGREIGETATDFFPDGFLKFVMHSY